MCISEHPLMGRCDIVSSMKLSFEMFLLVVVTGKENKHGNFEIPTHEPEPSVVVDSVAYWLSWIESHRDGIEKRKMVG